MGPPGSPHPTTSWKLNAGNEHQLHASLQLPCSTWPCDEESLTAFQLRGYVLTTTHKYVAILSYLLWRKKKKKSFIFFFLSCIICRTSLCCLCIASQAVGNHDLRNGLFYSNDTKFNGNTQGWCLCWTITDHDIVFSGCRREMLQTT